MMRASGSVTVENVVTVENHFFFSTLLQSSEWIDYLITTYPDDLKKLPIEEYFECIFQMATTDNLFKDHSSAILNVVNKLYELREKDIGEYLDRKDSAKSDNGNYHDSPHVSTKNIKKLLGYLASLCRKHDNFKLYSALALELMMRKIKLGEYSKHYSPCHVDLDQEQQKALLMTFLDYLTFMHPKKLTIDKCKEIINKYIKNHNEIDAFIREPLRIYKEKYSSETNKINMLSVAWENVFNNLTGARKRGNDFLNEVSKRARKTDDIQLLPMDISEKAGKTLPTNGGLSPFINHSLFNEITRKFNLPQPPIVPMGVPPAIVSPANTKNHLILAVLNDPIAIRIKKHLDLDQKNIEKTPTGLRR